MKIFYLLFFVLFCKTINAQTIPNAGFENWSNQGSYDTPDYWVSYNSTIGTFGVLTAEQGTPGAVGSSYIKVTTKVFGTSIIGGLAISNSTQQNQFATLNSWGYPAFSFNQRPLFLTGKIQYQNAISDSAVILLSLTKWDSVAMQRILVGQAILNTPADSINTTWTNFSIPISYSTVFNYPDSAQIVIQSSGAIGFEVAGNSISADDLAFDGSISTSILEKSIEKQISVFPNPTNNLIIISNVKGKKLSLTDILGKIYYSINNADTFETIDLSAVPKGIYLIKVSNEKEVTIKKVVKE